MNSDQRNYVLGTSTRVLLHDLKIPVDDVVSHAGLADIEDLWTERLSRDEFYSFFEAVEALSTDPLLPLRVGEKIEISTLSMPLLVSLASESLRRAFERLSLYKSLLGPCELNITPGEHETEISFTFSLPITQIPEMLLLAENVFCVRLGRIGTRDETISPTRVIMPMSGLESEYADFFGCVPEVGDKCALIFRNQDLDRAFITADEDLVASFEPVLDRQLAELSENLIARIEVVLVDALPGGEFDASLIARRLAMSKRTLQRRLAKEETTFQLVLQSLRERLAKRYLRQTEMSNSEIGYMLGFQDPNSFARAFQNWTGTTPREARRELRL